MEKLTEEVSILKETVNKLILVIEELSNDVKNMKKSTSRMDSHIDFVEETYDTLKKPINYIAGKINGIQTNKTLEYKNK